MNSLVSVIVPTYNRENFIEECVDSILRQTYEPLELLVVDDGSTDGTKNLIKSKYNQKVLYLEIPHSGLPAAARNAGIAHARGDYIAFCDSDDYWKPDKLDFQLKRLKDLHCNCSCTDAYVIDGQGETVLRNHRFRFSTCEENLLWANFIITSSVVLDRRLLVDRQFTVSHSFPAYQDYVLWLKLSRKLKVDFITQPFVYYRRSENTMSASVRHKDASLQLRILFTQAAFYRHPVILLLKFLRLLKALF